MTTVVCTPDEHRLIVGGATQLVVPGDVSVSTARPLWPGSNLPGVDTVAPARWVDATGPCPNPDCFRGLIDLDEDSDGDLHGDPCPDCIDGRKRVALTVECENCGGGHFLSDDEMCMNCQDGSVVFAHATVEVLSEPFPFPLIAAGESLFVANGGPENGLTEFVPGRDFVVLLDHVELTP